MPALPPAAAPCLMKNPLLPSIASLVLWPLAAHGTIVTTITDENDGLLGGGTGISLREAVKYSPAGDTITFDAALSGQTIRLTLGELLIAQSLTIDGSALAARIALSGDKTGDGRTADDTRVINITTGTVVLDSLVITGGNCPAGSAAIVGGGIRTSGGTTQVTIRNSSFTGNAATAGAGIYLAAGSITLADTVFSSNAASNQGGAIYAGGALAMQNCAVTGNTAGVGAGIQIVRGSGALIATLENSTVSENIAQGSGGGISNSGGTLTVRGCTCSHNYAAPNGGGIYQQSGSLLLENSTLFGNTAKGGGGGLYGNGGSVDLRNTTVSGNTANSFTGGGIAYQASTMTLGNSIVSGNAALNAPLFPDISGTFTGTNNLTSGAPLLAPLGDYGGPTKTMPPLPGSPAINAGGTATLTTDQRGFPRVSTPDIGAAEYQGTTDLTRFWKLDFDGDGSPFGVEQALGTDPLVSDPANPSNLSLPSFRGMDGVLTLGFNVGAAVPGTRWIVRRSPDLSPGSFQEIYRFDGSAATCAPGYGYLHASGRVVITEENPSAGGAFYRLEAAYEP
jgi:predicted outer membrane repeat protein